MKTIFRTGKLKAFIGKLSEVTRKQQAKLELAHVNDISGILELFYREGWVDFGRADLEYLFRSSPQSCFKFIVDDKMIGVTFATMTDNDICYPNSLLISKEYRKTVKFSSEMHKLDRYLKSIADVHMIYAIEWLIDVYADQGGYKSVGWYQRFNLQASTSVPVPLHTIITSPDDEQLQDVFAFLKQTYHHDRQQLIRFFLERELAKGIIVRDENNRVIGWGMVRDLPKGIALGPIVAVTDGAAVDVIQTALSLYPEQELQLDAPLKKFKNLLDSQRIQYTEEGAKMMKMHRGNPALRENEERLYAIFSQYID